MTSFFSSTFEATKSSADLLFCFHLKFSGQKTRLGGEWKGGGVLLEAEKVSQVQGEDKRGPLLVYAGEIFCLPRQSRS